MNSNESSKQCSRSRWTWAATGAGLLALGWLAASCTMPELTAVTAESFPQAEQCGKCHVQIHAEWAASPHARAYVSPAFRDATDDYRFSKCLGCHAPRPSYIAGRSEVRDAARQAGVTCAACHLEQGRMTGPLDPTGVVAPHPVNVDGDRYRRSDFCGRCHEGAFAQWRSAKTPDKPTCQHCHMPEVTRKMTQATGGISGVFVAAEKPAAEKRHTFQAVPAALDDKDVAVEVFRKDGSGVLRLTNRLPHNLPTGDFGLRIITVDLEVLDGQGGAISAGHWELTSAGGGAIRPGATREWTFPLPAEAGRVRVTLRRLGREDSQGALLLRQEAPIP